VMMKMSIYQKFNKKKNNRFNKKNNFWKKK